MKIIVVGMGNVGTELVKQLSKEDHDIIVIDKNEKAVERAVEAYDTMGFIGNGVSYDTLSNAGVSTCDLIVACTQYDEMNILCCLVSKKLGAKETIARVRNEEYSELFSERDLGLSSLVNPELETAKEIARLVRFPSAIKIEPFARGMVDIIELKVTEESIFNGVTLKSLSKLLSRKVLICAVERAGEVFIPSGEFTTLSGDKIYITAQANDMTLLFKDLELSKGAKKIMIIGGSRIAYYLALELEKSGIGYKIIEKNEARCAFLSENLENAEIIHGDGTDRELLLDEGIEDADVAVTLCGIDEQNIIISMFAVSKKVGKVITRTDNPSYFAMLENSGIDSIVSTKSTTANRILKYVRGKIGTSGSAMNKLYKILGDKAEVIEFTAKEDCNGLSTPLAQLKIKQNTLVAGIIRNRTVITPRGTDTIEPNDIVLVFTTQERCDNINDILE
ncbi:MAG: Trk system potassium transporter TrkA [Clostridia bacterium]|nr:Trk system potassium transporter TrkA [Clostridia bacterium]